MTEKKDWKKSQKLYKSKYFINMNAYFKYTVKIKVW